MSGGHAAARRRRRRSIPYDLAKAKELLTEAGFGDGFEVELHRARRQCRRDRRSRPRCSRCGRQIGVKLKIEQLDNATRTDRYRDRRLPDADSAPGPTTSPTRARSPPTSPTTRTSSPCIPAGRTTRPTSCSRQSQQEMDPAKRAAQYKRDPGDLQWPRRRSCPLYETPYPVALQQEGEGLRADPARQQHLRRRHTREVSVRPAQPSALASASHVSAAT